MRLADAINIADLRELARRRLPRVIFDYLDGGAEDEVTLAQNRAAFQRHAFIPRVLSGASPGNLSVTLFGDTVRVPWIVGPTGLSGVMWHEGDFAVARAAERAGAVYAQSTGSNIAMERLAAKVGGVRWFQLYPIGDRTVWGRLIERARAGGFRVLVVTIDSMLPGNRERDRRHGFSHHVTFSPSVLLDGLTHPRWLAGVWLRGGASRLGNIVDFVRPDASSAELVEYMSKMRNPNLAWDDLAWMKAQWGGPFVVKGLLSPLDAQRAADIGADGIVVSNHGGRALDGAIATLDALPPIVDAVGDRITVLMDGGVRRGADVVKALALGAKAVVLGRAQLYGLAAAGEAGVDRALEILSEETHRTMALIGCPDVQSLSRACLCRTQPVA